MPVTWVFTSSRTCWISPGTRFDGIPSYLDDDSNPALGGAARAGSRRIERRDSILDPYALSAPGRAVRCRGGSVFRDGRLRWRIVTRTCTAFLAAYFSQDPAAWSRDTHGSEKVRFFPTPGDFASGLPGTTRTATELWAGFYKKETGKPSITWPESVDEALCCGWIDGIRKSLDESRYMIRFTPRKPTSTWSAINIKRVAALQREGRMLPAGLKAFEARRENKSGIYAYEQKLVDMPEPYSGRLQKNKTAWKYFQAQSPAVREAADLVDRQRQARGDTPEAGARS